MRRLFSFAAILISSVRSVSAAGSVVEEWIQPLLSTVIWPVIALVIAWMFRKPIQDALARLKAVRGGDKVGVEFGGELQEQKSIAADNQQRTEIAASAQDFEKLKAEASVSILVRERAERIRDNLQKSGLNDAQKTELGTLIVAALQINNDFWRIYTHIFGSQIQVLQELNSRNIPETELQKHFENTKERFPAAYTSFSSSQYFEYLINNDLADMSKGLMSITEAGKQFLIWMTQNHLSYHKGL